MRRRDFLKSIPAAGAIVGLDALVKRFPRAEPREAHEVAPEAQEVTHTPGEPGRLFVASAAGWLDLGAVRNVDIAREENVSENISLDPQVAPELRVGFRHEYAHIELYAPNAAEVALLGAEPRDFRLVPTADSGVEFRWTGIATECGFVAAAPSADIYTSIEIVIVAPGLRVVRA